MRVVQGGFEEGTPAGGTVVRAFFLNAVMGELIALLQLFETQPLATGDDASDHHQLADLVSQHLCRVQQSYPDTAPNLAVLIDPAALLLGEWPFRVYQNSRWVTPPIPDFGNEVITPIVNFPAFNDELHGERGAGDLHAIATEQSAGFLSPEGFRALTDLASTKPNVYRSGWIPVNQPGEQLVISHPLGKEPGLVEFRFKRAGLGPVPIRHFFNNQHEYVGVSVWEATDTTIKIAIGDKVWQGYTDQGLRSFSDGEIQVIAINFGG